MKYYWMYPVKSNPGKVTVFCFIQILVCLSCVLKQTSTILLFFVYYKQFVYYDEENND